MKISGKTKSSEGTISMEHMIIKINLLSSCILNFPIIWKLCLMIWTCETIRFDNLHHGCESLT